MAVAIIIGKIAGVWLTTDFLSGFFHWLEDAYGNAFWPVFGRHVTKPNILHHFIPRAFVTNSWYLSSRLLLLVCSLITISTLAAGAFNWMVALALLLGANANQVHKWSHRTRRENGAVVRFLQRLRLIQSPAHHHRHHTLGKDSHYCVLTDFLNPVLDRISFWTGLEWLIARAFGIQRRNDATAAAEVLRREPEFFGEYVTLIRQRLASAQAMKSPGP
jgi:ubiquitin-conjugating enzyme E2 variant